MKIFLAGGGTGGATAPLLAVAEALEKIQPGNKFYLVADSRGVNKKIYESLPFQTTFLIIPSGKWRRYFSFRNFFDIFKIFAGFIKSIILIRKYRPDIVFGAGSFVQVPVAYAAYLSGVPVVIHQQDVRLLLSNRLCAFLAKAVTVSFSYSGKEFPEFSGMFKKIHHSKIFLTGNPARKEIFGGSATEARKIFQLNDKYPVALVVGGSSGAARLNDIVISALPDMLKFVQVIHITGKRKERILNREGYHVYEFLGSDLKHAYAVADMVLSRGGMSTITELSLLGKLSIFVPLPHSPQEDNVAFLNYFKLAIGVTEDVLNPELLVKLLRKILWDRELQQSLQENFKKMMPGDAQVKIAKILIRVHRESYK